MRSVPPRSLYLLNTNLKGVSSNRLSPKHLQRRVREFAGRHNTRGRDTIDQMRGTVRGLIGKRLQYRELIEQDNGLLFQSFKLVHLQFQTPSKWLVQQK